MPFIPQRITTYTVAELIDFIIAGEVTIKNIAMLKRLDLFSTDELMQFIASEAVTFEDMQRCGLHFRRQNELRERLQLWNIERSIWRTAQSQDTVASYNEYIAAFPAGMMVEQANARIAELNDEETWQAALRNDSRSLYEHYLSLYPEGAHHVEAESRIRELKEQCEALRREVFADMRINPLKYTPHVMRALMHGADAVDPVEIAKLDTRDVAARFIALGNTLTYRELVEQGIIPPAISEMELMAPEFEVPQTNSFEDFPLDRTDIYFLGVPRSGKSSVLAGLFNTMTRKGNWRYVPNINEQGLDNSMAYFNGLVRSISAKKPPIPTAHDTINYINIDVPNAAGTKRTAHLNFVEISGECFNNMTKSFGDSRQEWDRLGASRVLANKNRKVLFFLLDYNTIQGNQFGVTPADQMEALNNALTVLSHDGPNHKNPQKDCTLSRVESVGVIMTKTDLMGVDSEQERLNIALEYLNENFFSFMNDLTSYCERFDINRNNKYKPLVFTFSLGAFYPGNTLLFDHKYSMELARHIEHLVPTRRGLNLF